MLSEKIIQTKKLLDITSMQKFDTHQMYKIYDEWPNIAKVSYETKFDPIDFKNLSHIVFAGMGGSGAINDIFSSIGASKIQVSSIKGHILPRNVDSDTLVVATSVSGNTAETLTIFDSAKRSGSKIIAFSSGGQLQKYCNLHKIEYRNIPMIHSPRTSFASFLYSMLHVLEKVIPIRKEEILGSISQLQNLKKQISSSNLTETNPALELANWIRVIPLVYYPQGLYASAIRFKNSLQENAKSHVIVEEVGEACHNGIVSWETPSPIQPILMEGQDDHVQTKQRWKILKQYFEEKNIHYKEIFSVKGSLLSKLVNLNYLLDYSTIYYAILHGTDPSPIKSTDFVKSRL